MDVSFIGPWGEGAGECSEENIDRMIETYRSAHPKTPLVGMISGYKMTSAARAGAGWRCDCFGDLGFWRHREAPGVEAWNHHYDCYPQAVVECGAVDAWKNSPVVFESCGVPMRWFTEGFDLELTLQQGLKFHGSVLMPKSAALPEEWTGRLLAFCNDLGYRFVLRQLMADGGSGGSEPVKCSLWIENVGVAPIYRRYDLALRFTQGRNSHVHRSEADILEWLPGDVILHEDVRLPGSFEAGRVEVSAGLVHPETGEAKVRFANEGTSDDGWLALGDIEIG